MENLEKAENTLYALNHLTYVTLNVVKDKKILLKILSETKDVVAICVNSILQYEYLLKRINLYQNHERNLLTFEKKCAQRYGITEDEIAEIKELLVIMRVYKNSHMELIKNDRLAIISESAQKSVPIEKIKDYLALARKIFSKTKEQILR